MRTTSVPRKREVDTKEWRLVASLHRYTYRVAPNSEKSSLSRASLCIIVPQSRCASLCLRVAPSRHQFEKELIVPCIKCLTRASFINLSTSFLAVPMVGTGVATGIEFICA